jgi:hypothetical protein
MSEVNEGVGIILARMETNPEEFFGMGDQGVSGHKWRWIFAESLREVMTEPEKAALHSGMTKVRRLEITHKAIATVMPQEEEDPYEKEDYREVVGRGTMKNSAYWSGATPKPEGKKMIVSASQMEMIKRINGGKV